MYWPKLSSFTGWCDPVCRVIEATPEGTVVRNRIIDLDPLPEWSRDRVTLLGDAAHPCTPDLGQGLCQATEDAVVLGARLASGSNVCGAFKAYAAARKPRSDSVTLYSRKIAQIGKLKSAWACGLRNNAIRIVPERVHLSQLASMFRFEP